MEPVGNTLLLHSHMLKLPCSSFILQMTDDVDKNASTGATKPVENYLPPNYDKYNHSQPRF